MTLLCFSGNALGYVRMVKSGGLNFCAMASAFIPDLKNTVNFEELCRNSGFFQHCIDSARQLDNVVQSLRQNMSEGTNYFKVKLISQINKYFVINFQNFIKKMYYKLCCKIFYSH
jgi:WASH complex subunit 7